MSVRQHTIFVPKVRRRHYMADDPRAGSTINHTGIQEISDNKPRVSYEQD